MDPQIIGLLAGSLTTISFIPQVYKTWQSKSAKDLSLGMFLIFVGGVVLWLIYGVMLGNLPIILTNTTTLLLSGALLWFKLTFKD